MRLARSIAAAGIVFAVLCGQARAGQPFAIGTGAHPDVAMEAGGVAHIVWREPTSGNDSAIKYCRLPAGARACSQIAALGGPVNLDDPLVVLGGGAIYVVVPHYVNDTIDVFTSTDGGGTFAGPATITTADPANNRIVGTNTEEAVYGPGDSLSIATWNPGEYLLNVPVPPAAGPARAASFSTPFVYNFSVALFGGTPVTTAWEIPGSSPTRFAFWTSAGANFNDAASWSGPVDAGQGEDAALAGGPGGLYLMTTGYGSKTFPNIWEVRKFNGGAFGAPTLVASEESSNCGSCNDLFQDASGGLYAAWRGAGATIRMATSGDGGATFTTPLPIVQEDGAVTIANTHVVAVPGGTGLVVWDQNGDRGQIRAADLSPLPPPPPVLGESVNVQTVKGQVLVKLPAGAGAARQAGKGQGFVPLTAGRQIPVGSVLDTSRGTVALTAAAASTGATQSGQFTAGIFQVLQARDQKAITDLRLQGGSFTRCTASAARKRLSSRTVRALRGDAKGSFRTRGRYAAATVRGTAWTMTDRCDGTLTRVRRGVVVVRDLRAKRTITVRAGKSYLARAR